MTRCRHCRIFFLTHPRNAGRRDLGCPFGCRQAHRKESSTRRSVEYYRTKEGKIKKKIQNGRRSKKDPTVNALKDSTREKLSHNVAGTTLYEVTLNYFQMVTSLIEGRRVGRDEILVMLSKVLRQHSMERQGKSSYIVKYPRAEP